MKKKNEISIMFLYYSNSNTTRIGYEKCDKFDSVGIINIDQ